jgi:class 3 adenylate cyclase
MRSRGGLIVISSTPKNPPEARICGSLLSPRPSTPIKRRWQEVHTAGTLSAILAADVAGYSRLMHHDEEATHAKLTALLAGGVEPAMAEHGGRIVKNTGDGFLAEFPSAVEAVRAAVQFQARIKELTIGDVEDRRVAFRVGVNIGDVIVVMQARGFFERALALDPSNIDSLGRDKLSIQGVGEPRYDFVLHIEQIGDGLVEPLGP